MANFWSNRRFYKKIGFWPITVFIVNRECDENRPPVALPGVEQGNQPGERAEKSCAERCHRPVCG